MSASTKIIQAAAGVGGEPEGAWDLSYAYYDPPESPRWDISTAVLAGSKSTGNQDTAQRGLFFKPDGTKMYLIGMVNDKIYEYDLSTAWAVSTASFSQDFNASSQDNLPKGLFFKPDGTKIFTVGDENKNVYEYDLSTAWDVSSASYSQSFSILAQEGTPEDVFFKPDGTKMYITGATSQDILEYDLSTAWDVSSASYLQGFDVSAKESSPRGLSFKTDGTKVYVIGSVNDSIHEYDLSTAWDISSATFNQSFAVEDNAPEGMFFKPDGSTFYVTGAADDLVRQYNLGGFNVNPEGNNPNGIFFKPDGLRMYICGTGRDAVSEYTLTTAFDTSTATYTREGSTGVNTSGVFFKPDGTRFYIVDQTNDQIDEYSLSTAWDASSATKTSDFNVGSQDTFPEDVHFKPDGTKMYMVGSTNDNVYEYDLSTAWSVSSASYSQTFSVSSQQVIAQGLFFKPDGKKMFVSGSGPDGVMEYELSTAWDISTATFTQTFTPPSTAGQVEGIWFNEEGTLMFTVRAGFAVDFEPVFTYSLGVQE